MTVFNYASDIWFWMIFKILYLLITVSYNYYSLAQCISCSDLDYVLSLITNVDQITSTRSTKQHAFVLFLHFWSCGCQNFCKQTGSSWTCSSGLCVFRHVSCSLLNSCVDHAQTSSIKLATIFVSACKLMANLITILILHVLNEVFLLWLVVKTLSV